jgi:hypothetical protein
MRSMNNFEKTTANIWIGKTQIPFMLKFHMTVLLDVNLIYFSNIFPLH